MSFYYILYNSKLQKSRHTTSERIREVLLKDGYVLVANAYGWNTSVTDKGENNE